MAGSNYPNGFDSGVLIRELLLNTNPRKNLFVGNNSTLLVNEKGASDSTNNGTFLRPFSTLDYAVGQAVAGDVIWVRPGHTTTVSAAAGLDLDVAGITIVFMGNGTNRGTITFDTAVGADMDVDAANITLIRPRFVAGIDALTGPIDVNAANFRVFDATWEDGTTINTTDCVVADAAADDLLIDGFIFIDGDAAGTQKQSFIQVAGALRPTLKRIRCTGDFGTGIIENGTAWTDALLEDLVLDNAAAGPVVCILLQATSTGWVRFSSLRVASGTTYLTAANDMQFHETYGTGTDATTGEKVGTIIGGDIEGILGDMTTAAASGAVTTADPMMAYIKQLVTEGIARDAAITTIDDFLDTEVAAILADTDTISGVTLPANPTANSLAAFIASGGTALGTELADSRSIVDALGHTGTAFHTTGLGYWARKTITVAADEVTQDLFLVAGGAIQIISLIGYVDVEIGAVITTAIIILDATAGAGYDLEFSTAVAITGDVVGTMYMFSDANPAVLTPLTPGAASGGTQLMKGGWFCPAGMIEQTMSADPGGAVGDHLTWYLTYEPLVTGVTVTAQ